MQMKTLCTCFYYYFCVCGSCENISVPMITILFFFSPAASVDASYCEYMISATLTLQEEKEKSIQPAQINIF